MLALLAFFAVAPAWAQTSTGVVLTNSSTSPLSNPLLWLQEVSGNSATFPLFEVSGASNSATLGMEVTSTATPPTGSTPNPQPAWSMLQPPGYGGLTLFQNTGASSAANVSSPVLSLCSSQFVAAGSAQPACWSLQALGGGGTNPPDILSFTRLNSLNTNNNITVLFPAAINLATAPYVDPMTGMQTKAGQITVGPQPVGIQNANTPATFTGGTTMSSVNSATTQAGPAALQSGQVINQGPGSLAQQGYLQVLQSYFGTNGGSTYPNQGLLACPDTLTTPPPAHLQSVVPCNSITPTAPVGQAENWVGVYNNIAGQGTGTTTILIQRHGRVPVKSFASAAWNNGDFVCKDDTNSGYSVSNGSTPCPAGESIGISVGEASAPSTNLHLVDLIQSPSTSGGAQLTFFCQGATVVSSTLYVFPSHTGINCNNTTGSSTLAPVSVTGWLRNLVVYYQTAPGGADSISVYKCPGLGACLTTPALTCPVSGHGCTDFNNTMQISRGDGIQVTVGTTNSTTLGKDIRVSFEIQ